jgi:sigma-B regulation protein RsbU (phosphoserine phosphatase)
MSIQTAPVQEADVHHEGETRDTARQGSASVLHRVPFPDRDTQEVSRLASNVHYVYEDTNIDRLADELRNHPDVFAVAVVDELLHVTGVIIRKDFLTMMLRPFARDVYSRDSVTRLMSEPILVRTDQNILSAAEEIGPRARWQESHYYVLVDEQRRFYGTFSSIDMLSYLSRLTQEDIAMARQLQARIVRERNFVVGKTFEFVASSQAARGVGGDFYAIHRYAEGRWIAMVCDVAGKGVAASIITSVLWGMINVYDFRHGLTGFIRNFNRHVVQTFESEKFITGVFFDYDEASGRLRLCDMGHSHLLVVRNGRVRNVTNLQRNMPVGIVAEIEPKFNVFYPSRGDILFTFTDGLEEQQDPQDEEYSVSRVARVLRQNSEAPVETLAERISNDFHAFREGRPLRDDVTFSLMRFVEQEITL